jgi:hypothetical protein
LPPIREADHAVGLDAAPDDDEDVGRRAGEPVVRIVVDLAETLARRLGFAQRVHEPVDRLALLAEQPEIVRAR